jgi:macrolide transport system ATP-binding/permease protein
MTIQVLEVSKITKYYAAKLILDEVSLLINRTDRIGLVGENGTGKTTLANIIMDRVEPDEGRVLFAPGTEIGYLPQEAVLDEAMSVQRFLERAMGRLDYLRNQLSLLEEEMAHPNLPSERMNYLLSEYGAVQEEFSQRGGYDADYRLDQVFMGLDLIYIDRSRSLQTLSGGEKTRVMLASLLLSVPGLLILDEPTNHLDFASVDWLEGYLKDYSGAVMLISHDRHFLNKVVNQIAELSTANHKLKIYHGNYDSYLAERERSRAEQLAAYEAQQEEIKRLQRLVKAKSHNTGNGRPPTDGDKMGYDFKGGRVDKQKSREIQNARRRLDDLQANPLSRPVDRWHINPDFEPEEMTSRDVIRLNDVSKRFGDRILFRNVTATVQSGDRIVLYGPNGVGKTTLVKLLLGIEQADSGTVYVAANARIGYLDQEQESLDPNRTVLEEYSHDLIGFEEEHRANLHKFGLFSHDQVFQKISSLSVGQRRKLQIAKLIGQKANLLILDEPTNHLDLESVEQFEQALCEFPGTVLAISHDRYFIDRVATITWSFNEARLVNVDRRDVMQSL